MKKLLLTIVSAMMMALLAPSKLYAQLNVNSNGSVNLSSTSTATNKVTVGLSNNTSYTSANFYSGMASLSQPMNAEIALQAGSKLKIQNSGTIYLRQGKDLDAPLGSITEIVSGNILSETHYPN